MARSVDEFEFSPESTARVIGHMKQLTAAGTGWMNLMPGIPDEPGPGEAPRGRAGLFGSAPFSTTMCTWTPARLGRRHPERATLGILHPRGRHAIRQLRSLDAPLPEGWRIEVDHQRRGLVVRPPLGASNDSVLDWALRAGAALTLDPLTGSWRAVVYHPRRAGDASAPDH